MAWVVAAEISDDGGQNSRKEMGSDADASYMKIGMQPSLTNSVGKLEFFAGV